MRTALVYLAIAIAIVVAIISMQLVSVDEAPPPSPPEGSTEITSEAMPDLVITSVSVSPPGLVPPGEVGIQAIVHNQGSAAYRNTIVVRAPGNHSGAIPGGLELGESQAVVIGYPAVSPNTTYTMTVRVDPDDVIPEQDESNNESHEISFTTSA